jgi:3',5'-cyclic AMP phosphodiesterase CpdA
MAIESLILRYADVEARSLNEHVGVIASQGSVWWAWWKKAHEPTPTAVLSQAAEVGEFWLGLVNRRDGQFARAHCVEVRFGSEGAPIESPDPGLTPAYYRDDSFPAWFRFNAVEPLTRAQWDDVFPAAGVPRADQTLYWIEDGELRLLADQDDEERAAELGQIATIEAPGDTILHISDLHYGDDHGFSIGEPQGGPEQPTMIDAIADRIERLQRRIGLLVVSGDLTTKSSLDQLMSVAQPELERLLGRIGLDADHLVIVPGNHDIRLDDDAETRAYRHEQAFRNFLSGIHGERNREIELLRNFAMPDGWQVNVATLNSVRLRARETQEYGYVGPRAKPLMDDLRTRFGAKTTSELWSERVFNATVMHHHLVSGELVANPPEGKPVSVTLDAGKLIADLQEGSTHAVLHGHQHVPFIGTAARGRHIGVEGWDGYRSPLWLLSSGSAGAKKSRLSDEMRDNCFAIYRPGEDGLEVQMERFNPSHEGETMLASILAPL